MTPSILAILLIGAHFFGDWYLQPRWMATSKSSDFNTLSLHVGTVSLILGLALFHTVALPILLWKLGVNAIIHGIIDWNLWTFYKRIVRNEGPRTDVEMAKFEYWKDKRFYDFIALDQFMHLATLAILFL
jgi:hypothetical protein